MKKKQIELKIPDVGDTESIELVKWNLKEGEKFETGFELCELVTDKAAFSLEAPSDGILTQIIIKNGSQVKVADLAGIAEVIAD
ncbi:MAG: lipoyl domain-containing protein [Spirochaetia bacterium]|nr:lipoyl domain-containing protein [Spirochaetia bacterium]